MSGLVERIAAAVNRHTPSGADGCVTCWCGERFDTFDEQAAHVAEAIVEELGLTEDDRWCSRFTEGNRRRIRMHRFMSKWWEDTKCQQHPNPTPAA